MVIPGNTVYFIDSVDGTPAANATTEPFAAVKAALGDKLLNQASDQFKADNNSWGLVDQDAGTKSHNGTADMMATGLYGANNTQGETLSYAFTLPAGEYKLISGHREWWNMDRPMKATLTMDGKSADAGTLGLNGSSGDIINTFAFAVPTAQTLTYTITCTGSQAPVISFLAVIRTSGQAHVHETAYRNNGNGTHSIVCKGCTYKDNNNGTHTVSCKDCDFRNETSHSYTCKDNGNGTHTSTCADCGSAATESHTYANGSCSLCGAKEPAAHQHSYTYKDNKDGKTHTASCKDSDDTRIENHTFQGNTCSRCGYKKPASVTKPKKGTLSATSNVSKGIKISWKKISGVNGYYLQRKAGNGSWQTAKKITKASTTSWTDTKANKNGTKYQYRVCAYKGSVKGSYSSIKTIFRLSANKISRAANAKGRKISLKWSRNTKASGYQIQYSTSKKFKGAKTVKVSGNSKISKTLSSGIKKGKTYYVRIRCYKKSGKVTSYSVWSKTGRVKIKR